MPTNQPTCVQFFLWSPYVIGQAIIFLPCDFYLLLSFFFFPRLMSVAADWMSTQTLWCWTEGATYVRKGDHHVGHWPTFLVFVCFHVIVVIIWKFMMCAYYTMNDRGYEEHLCKALIQSINRFILLDISVAMAMHRNVLSVFCAWFGLLI